MTQKPNDYITKANELALSFEEEPFKKKFGDGTAKELQGLVASGLFYSAFDKAKKLGLESSELEILAAADVAKTISMSSGEQQDLIVPSQYRDLLNRAEKIISDLGNGLEGLKGPLQRCERDYQARVNALRQETFY